MEKRRKKRQEGEYSMKNFDVVALGELLIDFTENGKSAQGNMTYEANPAERPATCWQC